MQNNRLGIHNDKENNENDMTSVVWAVVVLGPHE